MYERNKILLNRLIRIEYIFMREIRTYLIYNVSDDGSIIQAMCLEDKNKCMLPLDVLAVHKLIDSKTGSVYIQKYDEIWTMI